MELFRFYLFRDLIDRSVSTRGARLLQLGSWLAYMLGWLLVLLALIWLGRHVAVSGVGYYESGMAVWLFLELAVLGAPWLVLVGTFLYAYNVLFVPSSTLVSLATPGDRWQQRMTFLYVVLMPTVPMWLLALPALVGVWASGATLSTTLGYAWIIFSISLLASLVGLLWFLVVAYWIYRSGIHIAFRARAIRVAVLASIILILFGAGLVTWYSFFVAPPLGPVRIPSDFGGGTFMLFLVWLSRSSLYGYWITTIFCLLLGLLYIGYRAFAYFFQRRYELMVSFKEAAIRANRRINTYVWLPWSTRLFGVLLQIVVQQWMRNASRIVWFMMLWVLWFVLSILLGMAIQRSMTEPAVLVVLTFLGGVFLALITMRCILPYVLPATPGGEFLRTVPVAASWLLRAQLVISLLWMLLVTILLWLLVLVSGLVTGVTAGVLAAVLVITAVVSVLGAALIRLRVGYERGRTERSSVRNTYNRTYGVCAGGFGLLATIAVATIPTQLWWVLVGTLVAVLLYVMYAYIQAEQPPSG